MATTPERGYPPDPGGNFASDVHRRVVSAIPHQDQQNEQAVIGRDAMGSKVLGPAKSFDAIRYYVFADEDNPVGGVVNVGGEKTVTDLSDDDLKAVINELIEDGDVQELKEGYKLTAQGAEVAAGDNADNGGRRYYGE